MELVKDRILLCSTCFKQGKYIIPFFLNDEKENELIYKCYKHNIINENNIYCITLTDKLKIKLNECLIHKGEIFCGWCEECDNNICQVCVGEELTKKNHSFILYNSVVSKNFEKESINSQIILLKDNLRKLKIYYEDVVEYEKDIKYLEKQINIIEFCYNLFFEQNIINYQILLNLKLNLEDSPKSFKKFQLMYEKRYLVFLSFIEGKYAKEIKSKKVNVPEINEFSNNNFNDLLYEFALLDKKKVEKLKNKKNNYYILILNSSLYDDEIKDYSQNENNKNILILLSYSCDILHVYDMNGNLINSILIQRLGLFSKSFCMIQYQSNIVLLYNSFNFYFIIFSPDFKNYEFAILDLSVIDRLYMFDMRKYIPICSFDYKKKIIKIIENKIAIFENHNIVVIKFNNNLIFKDKKYYKHKKNKNNNDYNPFKIELIVDLHEQRKRKYIDCIPIYYTGTEEKGIKNFLTITFNAKLDIKNIVEELKLSPLFSTQPIETDILSSKLVFIKDFDIVKNNQVVDQNSLFENRNNLYDYNKEVKLEEKLYTAVENKIIISVEVEKNDRDFKLINKFEFNLPRSEIIYLLKSQINYINLVYMYSKNYLLFIMNDKIYQIDDINNQVITIYNIDINFNKIDKFIKFNICTVHYYIKDLKKIEELILLKYRDYVYPYYLDNHEITQIKEFNFPEFKEIIEVNFLESSNSTLTDSLNSKRILVIYDNKKNDIKDNNELNNECNIKKLDDEEKVPPKKEIKNLGNKKKLNTEDKDKNDFPNSSTEPINLESIIIFN